MADDCTTPLNTIGDPFVIVQYGGSTIGGSHISPPFITTSTEFEQAGERWIEKETWTLQGQIINCESLAALWSLQDSLVSLFSTDYQDVEVGNPAEITLSNARLVSIEFGDSQYLDNCPYSITVEGYRGSDSAGFIGVTNPRNTFSWTENKDGSVTLNHSASAQGIAVDGTYALDNAKAFIQNDVFARFFTDAAVDPLPCTLPETIGPWIIDTSKNPGNAASYLVSQKENVDRIQGIYGVESQWRISQLPEADAGDTPSLLRYTSTTQKTLGEEKQISFQGDISLGYCVRDGAIDTSMSTSPNMPILRERYDNWKKELTDPDETDPFQATKLTDIKSESLDEDQLGGVLTFNLVFGSQNLGKCKDDFGVNVTENADSSLIAVSVDGVVTSHGADAWGNVSGCFYGEGYENMEWGEVGKTIEKSRSVSDKLYLRAQSGYLDFLADHEEVGDYVTSPARLNPYPLSMQISEDPGNKSISYNATFNDRVSWGAHNVDYTLSFQLPVKKIASQPFVDLCPPQGDVSLQSYHLKYLGFANLGKFSVDMTVDGTAVEEPLGTEGGTTNSALVFAMNKLANHVTARQDEEAGVELILTKNQSSTAENKIQSYSYEWMWTGPTAVPYVNTLSDSTDYKTVENLVFTSEEE